MNTGLRFDQMNQFVSAHQASPRITLVYTPVEDTTLHAGVSRYFYYKRATDQLDDGQFGQAVVLDQFNYARGFSRGASGNLPPNMDRAGAGSSSSHSSSKAPGIDGAHSPGSVTISISSKRFHL